MNNEGTYKYIKTNIYHCSIKYPSFNKCTIWFIKKSLDKLSLFIDFICTMFAAIMFHKNTISWN